MNTGAVSQPPITDREATADRSRNAGRKSDDNGGGGFAGLLAKIAGNREQGGGVPAPAQEAGGNDRNGGQLLDWLQAKAEAPGQEGGAVAIDPAAARQDSGAGGLTDIDVTALMQILGGSGALAGANGLAAMAARVANGTASEAETALMQAAVTAQEEGETLSPEQLILASLAKAARTAEEPTNANIKTATATLTVLRRETHLAPVADAGVEWMARLAAAGNRPLRAVAAPGVEAPGDIQPLQADTGVERSPPSARGSVPGGCDRGHRAAAVAGLRAIFEDVRIGCVVATARAGRRHIPRAIAHPRTCRSCDLGCRYHLNRHVWSRRRMQRLLGVARDGDSRDCRRRSTRGARAACRHRAWLLVAGEDVQQLPPAGRRRICVPRNARLEPRISSDAWLDHRANRPPPRPEKRRRRTCRVSPGTDQGAVGQQSSEPAMRVGAVSRTSGRFVT